MSYINLSKNIADFSFDKSNTRSSVNTYFHIAVLVTISQDTSPDGCISFVKRKIFYKRRVYMAVVTDIFTPLYSRRKFRNSGVNATFDCWDKLEALSFGLVGVSFTEQLSRCIIQWYLSGIFLKYIDIFSLLLLDFNNVWQRRVCVVTIDVASDSIGQLKACAVFVGHRHFRIISDRASTIS